MPAGGGVDDSGDGGVKDEYDSEVWGSRDNQLAIFSWSSCSGNTIA